ncbi:MAG: winged helix DNA-binding domain-containing protein [Gaiellaceae bacterium]
MTARVLSARELNRATLARQLLLRRARLSVPRAVGRTAGLQAQYSPSPYIGLWSRVEGFRIEALERALRRGAVVKASLMRRTLHLVAAADHPAFAAALLPWFATQWRRWYRRDDDVPGIEELTRRAIEHARAEPRTKAEMHELLRTLAPGEDPQALWWRVQTCAPFVEVPPSGTWRYFGKARFAPAGRLTSHVDALARLAESYLRGFGPATRADLSNWCGPSITDFRPGLEVLEPRLRRFRDERGRELIDVARAPLPAGDAPAPPRFLPKWDNVLLANADRSRTLPPEYREAVYNPKNGDVAPTFLVDGRVAGAWRTEGARVRLEPFAPLPRRVRRELEAEAWRLEGFLDRR